MLTTRGARRAAVESVSVELCEGNASNKTTAVLCELAPVALFFGLFTFAAELHLTLTESAAAVVKVH